jgi:hypothetical protein
VQQVQQVQRVQHGDVVAVNERSATGAYVIGPVVALRTPQPRSATRKSKTPEPWPPVAYTLPPTTEGIEAGRPTKQRSLFPPDDTQAGRLARLTGSTTR